MDEASDSASYPLIPAPWFPKNLVNQEAHPSTFGEGLVTPWGRLYGWDFTLALLPSWWQSAPEGWWGVWPGAIKRVECVAQNRSGLVLNLDDRWTAYLYPFPTGKEVSSLSLYSPWKAALERSSVFLAKGGLVNEHGDAVALFEHHTCISANLLYRRAIELSETLGEVHSVLVDHQTPNTERRWNDGLKSIEDVLKTNTLWRAPHTKNVVGLPSFHISLDGCVALFRWLHIIPQPRPLVNHLLSLSDRTPGLAEMAMLEQRLALAGVFATTEERETFYRYWADKVPPSWSAKSTLSIVNGGVWIWRYQAMLLLLAEARAFGLDEQARLCEQWLFDVSRIQARLSELRVLIAIMKGSIVASLLTALLASSPLKWPVVGGALLCALGAKLLAKKREPPAF